MEKTRITIFTETKTYDFKNVSSYDFFIEDKYFLNEWIGKVIKISFFHLSEIEKEIMREEFYLTEITGYLISKDKDGERIIK